MYINNSFDHTSIIIKYTNAFTGETGTCLQIFTAGKFARQCSRSILDNETFHDMALSIDDKNKSHLINSRNMWLCSSNYFNKKAISIGCLSLSQLDELLTTMDNYKHTSSTVCSESQGSVLESIPLVNGDVRRGTQP